MTHHGPGTSLPKNAFGPLVELGIQIANTLTRLLTPGFGAPRQDRRQG